MLTSMEKYNIPVVTWVRFEGDLDFFFGNGNIDWEGCGFSIPLVKIAVKEGFQWSDEDGNLVSVFPVSNMELFNVAFGEKLVNYPALCRCVGEDEAVAERDAHKVIADAEANALNNTPSQDDIYKAQQLLLLTEIANKLGDGNG